MANDRELAEAKRQGADAERVKILEALASDNWIAMPGDPVHRRVVELTIRIVCEVINELPRG